MSSIPFRCIDFVQSVQNQETFELVQEIDQSTRSVSPINYETEEVDPTTNEQTKSPRISKKDKNTNQSAPATSKLSTNETSHARVVVEFDVPNGWPTHTMVGDLKLAFLHYNFGPEFYEGKRYSASNTCSLDSALFLLYYIFKSYSENFRRLFDPSILVCQQLHKTFELVESKGWDIARIYWISTHTTHPERNSPTQHHDLFTTADNNVFQYVRELQKYVISSKCKSPDCQKPVRVWHSVDIAMP